MAIKKGTNYVPKRDDDFFNFQGNFVNLVTLNAVTWGVPVPSVTALSASQALFEPLYHTAQNKSTRNSADVLAHRQSRTSMHPDADAIDYRFSMVKSGDVPPEDPENCPKGNSQTKAKFVLRVGAKNAGKRFYGFFRWLNKRKPRQEGPWSNAQSVVIG